MKQIISKPNACFLALLEMIITDYTGTAYYTQEMMVDYFGITMFKGQKTSFNHVTYTDNKKNVGVHIDEKKINQFFMNIGIPLRAEYLPSNPFHDYPLDNLYFNEKINPKYIIYTFSYGCLFHQASLNDIGHAALYRQYLGDNKMIIYDPGPKDSGDKIIQVEEMCEAMWARKGGIYYFTEIL